MKIHSLQTGRVQVKRAQLIGQGHGLKRRLGPLTDTVWSDWLPTYAFAVEHADGVILIDTGSNAGLMNLPRWHPYFRLAVRFDIDREQEVGVQLGRIGIAPRDVKKVVLTHMHIDHDAGLKELPYSEVFASPGEVKCASGFAGQIRGYLPQRWPADFDPKPLVFDDEAFGPFGRSRRLTRDGSVIAIPTPGHTAHHISIAVVDEAATVLIAGDASYTEANLQAGVIDGVAEAEAHAALTLRQLSALAAERPIVFLPTHDPGSPERLTMRRTVSTSLATAAAQARG
jgi:glyoxylase-like metal-dependent hydrolase (beta-lactamase superfamily II)